MRERTSEPFEPVYADDDASYVQEYRFDVGKLQPLVAAPHSPDNRKNAADCRDVKIDRVYIGCAVFEIDVRFFKKPLFNGSVSQTSGCVAEL